MKDLSEFIAKDSYAKFIGVQFLECSDGTAAAKLDIKKHHLNSNGTVHGGAIFSLADSVFSAASNSREGLALAINVSVSYFKAVSEGTLTAAAREISLTPRLATYLIDITDEAGGKVALFQGTVYRKNTA